MLINSFILSRLVVELLMNGYTLPVTKDYLQVSLKLLLNSVPLRINNNIPSHQTWALLLSDISATYVRDPSCLTFWSVCRKQGTKALAWFRLSSDYTMAKACFILQLVSTFYNIEIGFGAKIGPFCCIDHANCIVIGQQVTLNRNITLMHGVTLGSTGERAYARSVRHPTLMSGVYVGTHSMVLGAITISHCNVIAAGSVALRSVLPWNVVVGAPARLLC
ncbi:MAG: serine O-acetyltransferase [Candidatus Hodgkinia cicadicola]